MAQRIAVRTLPEQIADDLGAAIARGEHREGERLLELAISAQYGVSRGPVREALRILVQRGLAVIYPRRGAFVAGVSLDSLVDLFNTRAVLMGLAARYFAVMAGEDARAMLGKALEQLSAAAEIPDLDPVEFVRFTGRISYLISQHCGSDSLSRVIEHQNQSSAWGSLWQGGRLDFGAHERRAAAAADYRRMGRAIERRDGEEAESVMRRMIMISRESAVAALAESRGDSFDSRRLLSA